MERLKNRREFLKKCASWTTAGALSLSIKDAVAKSSAASKQKEQPNILFICTDYQAGIDVPFVGYKFLQMPNLDRICREGKVFTRHYSTAPVCMPARYTWVTGTYPHTHGCWDNGSPWPEQLPTMMDCLKKAGYYSLGIGKMHFSPWERMAGFDRRIIADRKGNGRGDNNRIDDYAKFLDKHGLTRWDYLKFQSPGEDNIVGVYDWPYDEMLHIDHYVGEQAKSVIEKQELKEPWFLWVSFNGPHNPWDPPARCSEQYKKMDLPAAIEDDLTIKPIDHTRVRYNYTRDVVDRIDRTPQERKKIINRIRAGHFGNLTFIDEQLGKILKALDETGQLDNTIIIYSADHGSCLGDHDLIHKGTFYDRSAIVPFIVRYPRKVKPSITDAFSSHVDVMPTILSIAGAALPVTIEGKDLKPLFYGKKKSIQDFLILEIRGGTGIVTDRWKMSIYPKTGDGELYDLKADPKEIHNLYNKPEYKEMKKNLLAKMTTVNPNLSREIEKPPRAEIEDRNEFILKEGDSLSATEAPYCSGRNLTIEAQIRPSDSQPYDGVIIAQLGYQHGYMLYIENGKAVFAIKRWKEIKSVSTEKLENKAVNIRISLTNDGGIRFFVDGSQIAEGKAEGGWPVQPGKKTVSTTAKLQVGKWDSLISMNNNKVNSPFKGTIEKVIIRLS